MWARKQISKSDETSIIRDARDYALVNGLVLRSDQLDNDNCVAHIPFTLFPSPFPKSLYQECLDIQPIVSKLMLAIANDIEFIEETLSPIAQVDDFTRNLIKLNKIIQKEGQAQPIISCINRTDYMLDKYIEDSKTRLRVRQVEMNAIASGMSSHCCNKQALQNYLLSKYRIKKPDVGTYPDNNSIALVSKGLIDSFNLYGNELAHILLVAEERSLNFSDHFLIELEIHKNRPDIKLVRRRFCDLPEAISIGPNKELLLDNSIEIALVYFRYCYDPSNYSFKEAWDVRLTIERSKAIKCPSINFHLSGAKKFQQVLGEQNQLERYLSSEEAKRLSHVVCKFWSLDPDSPEGQAGFRTGLSGAKNLVLKPQREGGGHNIFGKDIKPFLEQIADSDERTQYILMEYIDGPREKNWILLQDDLSDLQRFERNDQLISELGIYGSIIADGPQILNNDVAGYLVRSKRFGINEGGVAAGFAGISSLILIDNPDQLDADTWSEFFEA